MRLVVAGVCCQTDVGSTLGLLSWTSKDNLVGLEHSRTATAHQVCLQSMVFVCLSLLLVTTRLGAGPSAVDLLRASISEATTAVDVDSDAYIEKEGPGNIFLYAW